METGVARSVALGVVMVIGVLVLQVLSSFLIGIGLKYEWQQFIFGLLILPMVALYGRSPHIRSQV